MDFSNLIILRKKKDLSQREIAKLLNISKSTYARWETQEEIIPLKHFAKFCDIFKVTMDYVLKINKKNDYYKYNYKKAITKEIIGQNIKRIRLKNNLSQKDLAKLFNTSQSTISAYENGHTLVLTIFLYELACKFNLSMDDLCHLQKEEIKTK